MRVASVRTRGLPAVGTVDVEVPAGLVALVAAEGRVRRALARVLTGGDDGVVGDEVTLVPRAPDPMLGRLPEGLLHRLRTGRGFDEADAVVEAGARALAWTEGLDRVEAARIRLGRLRSEENAADGASAELILARIRELEGAPSELATLDAELRDLRADDIEVSGDLEQATMEWLRERQDAETHLQAYRDRARELRARLGALRDAGAAADCPVCGRPLADHLDAVRETLEDEWEGVVQDGSWWRRRREQLEGKPERLQTLERKALRVHAATEELGERVERARGRVLELEDLRSRLAALAEADRPSAGMPPRPVWDAADRALADAARRLVEGARARVLDRLAGHLVRITAGRLLGATWSGPGHLVLEAADGPLHPPGEEDAAAAWVAARIATVELLWEEVGARGPGIVIGDPFDRLDDAARVRAVDLLGERCRSGLSQVLLLTRGDVVDRFPEGFDAVFELRGDGTGVSRVPAGLGGLRLSSAPRPGVRPRP